MRSELLGKLSPYQNKLVKVTEYQQTNDIIKELLKGHEKYKNEYDKISSRFWKGDVKKSLQYVFSYLKKNVQYRIEPDTRQSIKSPAAIFATAINGYNDCKHYSSIFGGLIDSWNRQKLTKKPIEWSYRFANYKLLSSNPHHVFVVVKDKGKEIWCDAVLSSFDQKKQYLNKIDKKPKMALYQISGVNCECPGNCDCEGNYGMPQISGKRDMRREKRRVKRTARRSGENCTGRRIPKLMPVAIAGRKAFLALIRLNAFKLGFKMHQVLKNPNTRQRALETWCKMGGDANTLKRTVEKWRIAYNRKNPSAQIGVAFETLAATAATYIAAFAPIIALAAKFLPEGKAKEIMNETVEVSEAAQSAADQLTEGSGGGDTTGAISPNILYGALALGGLYLLTRKK
jgi:hypothetical protein